MAAARDLASRLWKISAGLKKPKEKFSWDFIKHPRPSPYKLQVADYVKKQWSTLSLENRSMLKQSFVNLTVPAVYSGVVWLVSAGAHIASDILFNRGTIDDQSTTQLPAEVQAARKELNDKFLQLFEAFKGSVKGHNDMEKLEEIILSLKDERETDKSEIIRLRDKLLEKDSEMEMFKDLLAGRMRQVGVLWLKYFAKNLNKSSLLSYYDSPESVGLIYWNPN